MFKTPSVIVVLIRVSLFITTITLFVPTSVFPFVSFTIVFIVKSSNALIVSSIVVFAMSSFTTVNVPVTVFVLYIGFVNSADTSYSPASISLGSV